MNTRLAEGGLADPQVRALLQLHLDAMHENSPPGSVHALDIAALDAPEITLVTAWDGEALMGCGALKELDGAHGEVKSTRTVAAFQRQGVGAQILSYIIKRCSVRGYRRLSLEAGSSDHFAAAHRLYQRFGSPTRAPMCASRSTSGSTGAGRFSAS